MMLSPAKKVRILSPIFSEDPLRPVASSDSKNNENNIVPTEKEIEEKLQKLAESQSVAEAEQFMTQLNELCHDGDEVDGELRKDTARVIAKQSGVCIILLGLEKWYSDSQEFADQAIASLVLMTYFVPAITRHYLINAGGLPTVLAAADKYEKVFSVRAHSVALLCNLSEDERGRRSVASENFMCLVIDTMEQWPSDDYIQECGCNYFIQVAKVQGMKPIFHQHRVCSLIANICDQFFDKSDNQVYKAAQQALNIFIGT